MRIAAAFIAIAVFVTIAIRIYLKIEATELGLFGALWDIYRFFTVWTNTLVGVICGAIALGVRPAQRATACFALAIAIVGGVYHAVLAKLVNFEGLSWVIDQMVHTVVPIAFVVFWVVMLPKNRLKLTSLAYWLAYPLIYCVYAIGRGMSDGIYPYPFLDVGTLGANAVAVNVVGLLGVFVVGSMLLLGIARVLPRPAID